MKEVSFLLFCVQTGGTHTYMNPCIKVARKKLCDMRLCEIQNYFKKKSWVQVYNYVLLWCEMRSLVFLCIQKNKNKDWNEVLTSSFWSPFISFLKMSRDGDINTFMRILNYYTQSIPCFLFYQNKILLIATNIEDSPHFFPSFTLTLSHIQSHSYGYLCSLFLLHALTVRNRHVSFLFVIRCKCLCPEY